MRFSMATKYNKKSSACWFIDSPLTLKPPTQKSPQPLRIRSFHCWDALVLEVLIHMATYCIGYKHVFSNYEQFCEMEFTLLNKIVILSCSCDFSLSGSAVCVCGHLIQGCSCLPVPKQVNTGT